MHASLFSDCCARLLTVPSLAMLTTDTSTTCPDAMPCSTEKERQLMELLRLEHPQVIADLRAPGCFRVNQSVAVAGIYRSGSTLTYNAVRLWAVLALGPGRGGMAAGRACKPWMFGASHSTATNADGGDDLRDRGTFVVCKDHMLHKDMAGSLGVVIMSRRAPHESICSRKLEGS